MKLNLSYFGLPATLFLATLALANGDKKTPAGSNNTPQADGESTTQTTKDKDPQIICFLGWNGTEQEQEQPE